VNVGKREGVCRDFAVLGYCEKGFDCDKQHVRECPDFAENGTCSTKGCKLPHVIRANRGRKAAAAAAAAATASAEPAVGSMIVDAPLASSPVGSPTDSSKEASPVYAEDGKMGDEFISLTFLESEDEESDEDEEEEEGDDSEEDDEQEEGGEEVDPEDLPGDDGDHTTSDIA